MSGEAPAVEEARERLERVVALIRAGDGATLGEYLAEFHPSDIADVVEGLDEADRIYLLDLLPAELASEALAEMESEERPEEILASLDPERIGELVATLADDDAADLIGGLEPEDQARVLAALPGVEAMGLQRLLQYPEDTAGGLMTTDLVAVPGTATAAEAIEEVRRQAREMGDDFYAIFVVDGRHRLLGTVSLQDVVLADPEERVAELVEEPVAAVPVTLDQEDVGRLMARYNVPSIPVVGADHVLLGRITWDDVMDVIEAEQTEDLLRLAGVTADEEVRGGWWDAVRSRLPWLFVNLGTAVLAAFVVYIYRESIAEAAVLAAIMPVIAGMGGNAATQALAVTVRRLALGEDSSLERWGVVGKELLVGMFNGVVLGTIAGLASYWWLGNFVLGFVVLLSMWGNLIIASLGGAFVPILLDRIGIDPAVASSVFVTTLTDLGGFFLLLGLATRLLL